MQTMSAPGQDLDTKPWYRQFWPWVVFGIPLATVFAGITTVIIAVNTKDSLVVGEYYKEGKAINVQKAAGEAASTLGLSGLVRLNGDGDVMELVVTGNELPDTLKLQVLHATQAEYDREILLTRGDNGYRVELDPPLRKAKWYLRLQPDDASWRLAGEMHFPTSRSVMLQPAID
jgi:hypothetical protein